MQIQEARLFRGLIHALVLDRGPLWFDGFGSPADFQAFLQCLATQFRPRLGRRRRFIPECPDTPEGRALLEEAGFRRAPGGGYQTIWLDLDPPLENLRAGLKKNWRGGLKKAQQAEAAGELKIEWHDSVQGLDDFLRKAAADQADKGYLAASPRVLRALAASFARQGGLLVGQALLSGMPVAGALILRHGAAATYQTGWADARGRSVNAQSLLLWDALAQLKARGVRDFDLGGVNDESAKGVKNFKTGLGGVFLQTPGLYH